MKPKYPHDPGLEEGDSEERLVHALLIGLNDDPKEHSQRVEDVRRAIEGPKSLKARWGISAIAAAAVIGVCAFLLSSQEDALAGVDQVLQHWSKVDQTFVIELEKESRTQGESRRGRGRRHSRGGGPRNFDRMMKRRLDGSQLFVRGQQQVLMIKGIGRRGPKLVKGFDGERSWYVGPRAPFFETGSSSKSTVEETLWNVSVDLWATLRELKSLYDVSGPTAMEGIDGVSIHHYVAVGRSGSRASDCQIEIWADAQTGQVHSMSASGLRLHHPRHRYRLDIRLESVDPLPESWFSEEAHR